MPTEVTTVVSKKALWAGRIISALPVLMLLFSAVMKLLKPAAVVEEFGRLGYPEKLASCWGSRTRMHPALPDPADGGSGSHPSDSVSRRGGDHSRAYRRSVFLSHSPRDTNLVGALSPRRKTALVGATNEMISGRRTDKVKHGRQKHPTTGNGKVCYIEMPAADIKTSASFYQSVFGWNIRTRGDGSFAFDDGVGEVSGTWVVWPPADD